MAQPSRPTPHHLRAATGKRVADVIAAELKVLFCGINPGLYSAAVGHHFARPGNRFWPALQIGGLTPRLLSPFEEDELLALGYGITNIVERASAAADELSKAELAAGGRKLADKIKRQRPRVLAILGVGAYRAAFAQPAAGLGLQRDMMHKTHIWLLPNPSGLNAHYNLPGLGKLLGELKQAVDRLV